MKILNNKQSGIFLLALVMLIAGSYNVQPIGTWYDCDYSIQTCEDFCDNDWGIAGEIVGEYTDTTTEMCCGDDASEEFSSFGKSISIAWDHSDVDICCDGNSCVDPFTSTCEPVGQKEFSGQTDDKYAYCSGSTNWADCDGGTTATPICSIPDGSYVPAGEIVGEYEDLETIEFCGDDDGEYYRHNQNGDDFGGDGCCNSDTDCVYYNTSWNDAEGGHPMTCFSTGTHHLGKYCNIGEWEDQDYSHEVTQDIYSVPYCNFEASNTTDYFECDVYCDTYDDEDPTDGFCCGDDADEYYIDDRSTNGGRACCNDDSYCVDSSNGCRIGTENYETNNRDGTNTCTDGLDNDCDGSIDSAQELSDCPSCGNGNCSIMIVGNNEVIENAANCPADCMGEFVGWEFTDDSKVNLSNTQTRNGSYSLNLFGTGSVVAFQTIEGLTEYDAYVVFGHVKKISGSPLVTMVVTDGLGNTIDMYDSIIAPPEWTRLELVVAVPVSGKLKIKLAKQTTGSVVFDDVAVIKKDHYVDDPIPYFDSNYRYGCCEPDQCWTGFGCQELTDEHLGFNESPVPVCVEDGTDVLWKLPYKKQHWYSNVIEEKRYAYCPLDNQCWQSSAGDGLSETVDMCVNKGDISRGKDIFCDGWTSRTSLLAANILNLSKTYDGDLTDHDDYTLVCDSARCFDWHNMALDLDLPGVMDNCKDRGLVCTYKSGDTLIAGFLLDNNVPLPSDHGDGSCNKGPNYYLDPFETDHPDSNPKCYLQEILGMNWGYQNDNALVIDFDFEPYFTDAGVYQSPHPNSVYPFTENVHKIQSMGFNNATRMVIFSNEELSYESLGDGIDNSILGEEFESWKKYKDGILDIPTNIVELSDWFFLADDNFDTIMINKKGDKRVEAIIETKYNPYNYFGVFYENITSNEICQNLENTYIDPLVSGHFPGEMQWYFNCTNTSDSSHSFIGCGSAIWPCYENEEMIYQEDSLFADKKRFEYYIWNDLTKRFRGFKDCIMEDGYDVSSIPDYYIDSMTNEEDFISYENRQTEGCCETAQCWDGFGCVDSYSLFDYDGEDPTYICVDGDWGLGYNSSDWENVESGYCAHEYQCYVSGTAYDNEFWVGSYDESDFTPTGCTKEPGAFYNDHYCLNTNWTTRTAVLAAGFLNFTEPADVGEFTLFCDNYSNTLNIYQDINYSNMNKVCVLKYHDLVEDKIKVAVGTSLNDDVSLFLDRMPDVNENACEGKGEDGFEACLSDILWWDDNKKIIVYNEDGMEFGQQGFLQELWDFLLNPIESVIDWVMSLFSEETITAPEDFDKFYAVRQEGRNISAVVVEKHQPYVLISYRGFVTNITSTMQRRDEMIEVSETGDGFDVSSTVFDILNRDWTSITARLRLKPMSLINDPPVVNMPDIQLNEDLFAIIGLDNRVDDPDNLDSEITWTYSGNTHINIIITPTTRVVIFSNRSSYVGEPEIITFTATDPEGLSDSDDTTVSSPLLIPR
ncbi:hypothetical protein HQ529_06220 [Candidatus Woesearchaeota archaeon]|nr:hypothetical protein [Candidatus Woesearchaeota archaeon]